MRRFFIQNTLFAFLVAVSLCGISIVEASETAVWKAGRAKIEASGNLLTLRLSLRNEGKTGRDSLAISGRWKGTGADYKELGNFTKEVALKQTAIIMVPLMPLGSPPAAKASLELSLKTGSNETDHKVIRLP